MMFRKEWLVATMVLATACGKKDKDDNNNNGPQNPSVTSIAPNFHNTAKSAKEVGVRVDDVHSSMSQGDLALKGSKAPAKNRATSVADRFLAGDALTKMVKAVNGQFPVPQDSAEQPEAESLNLADGSDCSSIAASIQQSYDGTLTGLKASADSLVKFDQALPEGVTKAPANDKFAVSYTIDLARIADSIQKDVKPEPGAPAAAPVALTGTATISAGANESAVGVEATLSMGAKNGQNSGNIQSGFAMYADAKSQEIKLSTLLNADAALPAQEGQAAQNVKVNSTFEMNVNGGALPAIGVKGTFNAQGVGENQNLNIAGEVKLAKKSATELSLSYTATANGKPQSATMTLANDEFGHCVVKRDAGNGGVRRVLAN